MPPRSTALPTRFFPADPESTDLTLPTPPSEFNFPPRDSGGPGPSSLAHRLSLDAASQGLLVSDLHVNDNTAAAGPTSTSRKRKAVAPTTTGARKRVQKTDQVDTSGSSGKGKGKRSQASAAGANKGKALSSTAQDIRVQPSSDVEDDDDEDDDDEEESNAIRPQSKKRLGSEAFGSGAASDDAYTDDDGSSSEVYESAEAPVGSSEEEEEPEEPARRKSGRRRRDSPSYVGPLHPTDPTAGGPGYEGFAATLFGIGGGGGGGALKSVKTLPPLVPPLLRGSEDLKALLLASVEDGDEEADDNVGVGGLGGMDAEGVHHQKPPAKSRPGLTTTQLAELERASDPYVCFITCHGLRFPTLRLTFSSSPADSAFATTLLERVAGRISALDTAYAKLSQELSKAQLEASVLGNVKSLLKVRERIPHLLLLVRLLLTRVFTGSSRHDPEAADRDVVAQIPFPREHSFYL